MKVFVIPDVHLKPWMFEKADDLLSRDKYDRIVFLGDLVDDWDQQLNEALYDRTFQAAIDFVKTHQNMLFCYGNHDASYIWEAKETGYSPVMRELILKRFDELKSALSRENTAFVHRIDNVMFSHAGVTTFYVEYFLKQELKNEEVKLDDIIKRINTFGRDEMWVVESPIWVRPQDGRLEMYGDGIMQVVGHTPVKKPLETKVYNDYILTLDTFSTYSGGDPIGDQRFVWIDTEKQMWEYAD